MRGGKGSGGGGERVNREWVLVCRLSVSSIRCNYGFFGGGQNQRAEHKVESTVAARERTSWPGHGIREGWALEEGLNLPIY